MTKKKAYSYIRFSQLSQGKGSSIERQSELAKQWAVLNGYELCEPIVDRGKSGFTGEHVHTGNLGKFLTLVEKGYYEKGSVLIVESLDRLGRDEALNAINRFTQILMAGIDIVTMIDVVDEDKAEFSDDDVKKRAERYTGSIPYAKMGDVVSIMAAAHNESVKKARRSIINQERARERAQKHGWGITTKCPEWVEYYKDEITETIGGVEKKRKVIKFKEKEKRIEILQGAIDAYIDNNEGLSLIAKRFNKTVSTWGKAKQWQKTSFSRIFRNRQLIGEYQPYKMGVDEKGRPSKRAEHRIPAGPPIENYYPAVIDEVRFKELQGVIEYRRNNVRKRGKAYYLIPRLSTCGYCGNSMEYHNKTSLKSKKLELFLGCSAALTPKCKYIGMPLIPMQEAIKEMCNELDLGTLLGRVSQNDKLKLIDEQLIELEKEVKDAEEKYEHEWKLRKGLKNQRAIDRSDDDINYYGDFIDAKELKIAKLEEERAALTSSTDVVAGHVESIRELAKREELGTPDDRILIRLKLRQSMINAIDEIICFPDGLRDRKLEWTPEGYAPYPFMGEELDIASVKSLFSKDIKAIEEIEKNNKLEKSAYYRSNSGRSNRCFIVKLRNGLQRVFHWDADAKCYYQREVFDFASIDHSPV